MPFAMACWNIIINIQVPNQAVFPQVSTQLRYQLNSEFSMIAVMIMCAALFGERETIYSMDPNLQDSKDAFNKEMALTSLRAKESCSEKNILWIQNWL